jgi:hypothetical protein
MYRFNHFQPVSKELMIKISILKTMMYCGVLWGLYDQGWAIKSDVDGPVFLLAKWCRQSQLCKIKLENYKPRKITPKDFHESLLPTLTRLQVEPALFNSSHRKFKLTQQMQHFFLCSINS